MLIGSRKVEQYPVNKQFLERKLATSSLTNQPPQNSFADGIGYRMLANPVITTHIPPIHTHVTHTHTCTAHTHKLKDGKNSPSILKVIIDYLLAGNALC